MSIKKNNLPRLVVENINIFCCPNCGSKLKVSKSSLLKCTECKTSFKTVDGIPLLYWANEWKDKRDVTDEVKSFYEKTPFPNYDEIDSVWKLRQKAKESIYVELLDNQIPKNAIVLEAGSGTGQLSNILGIAKGRKVFATDICLNSLKLANGFRGKSGIEGASFLQMNLFKPVFRPNTFDIVISNGVLHHTADPYLGFESIARLVKPGGYVIIGLYNRYGRKTTDLRRLIFNLTGKSLRFLDPYLRDASLSDAKKETWFRDQYKNPHESEHTIDEVLRWFDRNNIEFVNSIPKATLSSDFSSQENLFSKQKRGTALDHIIVQLNMLFMGGAEGGFYTMIGRKRLERA